MEYKICEKCGAKLHFRTQKCPICNTILTEASKIINDEITSENTDPKNSNYDITVSDTITNNSENSTKKQDILLDNPQKTENLEQPTKDYIYKTEVHHSFEFTEPLSNTIKVLLSAIASVFPMMGQLIGIFFGIFFSTYEDRDRKAFGKSLIILSIIMFLVYAYTLMAVSNFLDPNAINNLIK